MIKQFKICNIADIVLLSIGIILLLLLVFSSTKMNIVADSIDYYSILQRLTPEKEVPIVRNLHFAEQRSPGYSIFSLIPYSLISIVIEPLVKTEKITEYDLDKSRVSHNQMQSSEMMVIPPCPLRINNFLFKDFYIAPENSWYQWKLALSLLVTSIVFLIVGIAANALLLNYYSKSLKGFFLIPLAIFISPIFMRNIIDFPLYATLTAYGLSSLFLLFLFLSFHTNKHWQIVLTGIILGFLVLTRLELSILIIPLFTYYLFTKKYRLILFTTIGGLFSLLILISYNLILFDVPLHLGILRGDINTIDFNARYIFENILHPQSGVLFWTPILVPGLILLILSKNSILRVMGISSFLLILLYVLRIPIMYYNIGQGIIDIGGIPVMAPDNAIDMRDLIRSDINRYLTVLIPFSIIGISMGISRVHDFFEKRK